ncbi:haloacid dehalogenase superfamily, subfamily IA, variant 3 with third motif having DD or ED [Thermomonospora echinospora]|uniref:Haloacid dehalogenase superfamily, subfamily IA, variant 3 with third motif having DD or ED n=1 Tax=Thermomonospora echinospora TaxID=1992 RepID=A0A1H6C1A2_9ACTN|nr:HAD family phosphatase [Thermomonospora echinospora]SEG66497.1 haloacid dehalogenase superfamily, subfamily IA, variant 3 with third motif having DD or ED [Thermomonospora echinospora]
MEGDGWPRAVLFDMDGLLIDSEVLWFEVETEVMAWLGGVWGPQHQEKMVGGSLSRAAVYMLALAGPVAPQQEVERRLLDGMAERLSESAPLMPGAKELLAEVRAAGLPTALVSSSHRRLIEAVLEGIGREHFDVTVAGDEVARLKPEPEPYLTAAARLGVRPEDCVVLEDSPTGVAAAEAAGCVTVAVPGVAPVPPAPGRIVVESLREVDLHLLSRLRP